jgi:outer membrane protein assembly factor BamD (BamD/ComL family)
MLAQNRSPARGARLLDLPETPPYRARMNRRGLLISLAALGVLLVPFHSPAPLTYTPGEGWTWEAAGQTGSWRRERAKDQLDVAGTAFAKQDYSTAKKAAQRVVKTWPLSDYAPMAQYVLGRCHEAQGNDEKAYNAYAKLLKDYPRSENVNDVLKRQYLIAQRYLSGQLFKLWGMIPAYSSMTRTATMFQGLADTAPFSEVGPHAQLRVGAAYEKHKDYPLAVKAYERAADRYHDRDAIAADAIVRAGISYQKQARTAEYDQSMAGKAIETFNDFVTYYPNDRRVPGARKAIEELRREQARGNFETAKYYEAKKRWAGALVYYNEVLLRDASSPYAATARERIETIKRRVEAAK